MRRKPLFPLGKGVADRGLSTELRTGLSKPTVLKKEIISLKVELLERNRLDSLHYL